MTDRQHPPDDQALLLAWRAGDDRAGATLVRRHVKMIYRFFRPKVGAEAEELAQATFSASVESIDRLRNAGSFRAFLFGVARNVLLRHLRECSRDRRYLQPFVGIAAEEISIHSQLEGAQQQRLLAVALRNLKLAEQLVVELHYWEDLRTHEIAHVLEIPEGTVKWRLRQARVALRSEIERLGRETPGLVHSTVNNLERWAHQLGAAARG